MSSPAGDCSSSSSPVPSPKASSSSSAIVASRTEAFTFHIRYQNVLTPMRDGVKLAGDLYMPAIDGVVEPGTRRNTEQYARLNQ